ncbi:MAG: adenosylcobinamide-phosphate synthase CbiB [Gammaproteobacteria bacterium]|nr:adenosylcobinamide-phosphate synthase CbiB [Gammaproteobacteria bacterium]
MSALSLIVFAWLFEACFGWPDWLYRLIRHPVVWIGWLVQLFEKAFNRSGWSASWRSVAGALSTLSIVLLVTILAVGVSLALPNSWPGHVMEILITSSLIASRSLFQHVNAVWTALADNDLDASKLAVAKIVSRDPNQLDRSGVARACLESLAENTSDGVIAPLFWGILFGLPGLAAYKAVNTLDSMIGHQNSRYQVFGGFAARLDDFANWIPARLTGSLLAGASMTQKAFRVMWRDASKHRSPNAGWPEAALAGALGVRLSGPRSYAMHMYRDPWLNPEADDPEASDIEKGLTLYLRTLGLCGAILALLALSIQYAT